MLSYYIVDVFAEKKYTGNQLAVFTNIENLDGEQMQKIAKEINYSETTFITSSQEKSGGYDVRIFTPGQEIPFAGHPTLGTAYILQQAIIQKPVDKVVLNLGVGQIPVTINYAANSPEWLWMQQNPPTFHSQFSGETIAEILQLDVNEIDSRFPIQEVSTGLPFIIVPLKNLAALKKIKLNKDKYFQLIENSFAQCILVFCPETYYQNNHLSVRVFCDYLGIPEDPATGSANGCLAGYLVEYSYFGNQEINVRVEQGYEIDRPSLLSLQANKNGSNNIDVRVGGKVIMVAKGEFI